MKFRVFISVLLMSSAALAQAPDNCRHRIIFLPQIHADHYGSRLHMNNANIETAAKSQFEVARFLLKNKLPVFSEYVSTAQSSRRSNGNFDKVAAFTQGQFPNGIPEKYSDLDGIQKLYLIKTGGDALTSILGLRAESYQIPKLSVGGHSWVTLRKHVPQSEIDLLDLKRRSFALDELNRFFESHPGQKEIVLVYDATQSEGIRTHSDKFPPECIVKPTENFEPPPTPPVEELMISTRR